MNDIIYHLAWLLFIPAGIILFFMALGAIIFILGLMLDVKGAKRDSKNHSLHLSGDR